MRRARAEGYFLCLRIYQPGRNAPGTAQVGSAAYSDGVSAALPASSRATSPSRRMTLWVSAASFFTAGVALLGAGRTGQFTTDALADPGVLVTWGLPTLRAVRNISMAGTIGLLWLVVAVIPAQKDHRGRGGLAPLGRQLTRWASLAAACWAASGSGLLVLSYGNIAGISPMVPEFWPQLLQFASQLEPLRMQGLSTGIAFIICFGALLVLRLPGVAWLFGLALAALWPLALTGHSAGSANHELAVDSLFGHLLGVTLWSGGLAALALPGWRRRGVDVAARRYSTLAAGCFVLVAGSGVLNATVRLTAWSQWRTSYGLLVLAKIALLVLLGVAGWWQRRRLLDQLTRAAAATAATDTALSRPFWRLVSVELAIFLTAIGLGVALAGTAPAAGAVPPLDRVRELTGFAMPAELTSSAWFTTWRLDALWVTITLLLLGLYLLGATRLRQRGDHWPLGRILSFALGCAALLWATSGPAAVYGRVLFSAHMVGHMTVTMIVAPLLVLGAPITLALRTLAPRRDGSWGPREWLLVVVHSRFLTLLSHPIIAGSLFAGSLIAFYYTNLFELSLRTHTGHVAMHLHFLLTGYLFASVLIGVDPGPPRPAYPLRLVMLFATMAFHAFFGVALVSGSQLLAPELLGVLDRTWGRSPLADQQYGGAVAWGLGEIPVLLLAMGIAWAWVRSDDRQARREDRRADRDGDAQLHAYNDRLARLGRREP